MSLSVVSGDPCAPEARALLQASQALMQGLFPPEENHYLAVEELAVPDIAFFLVHRAGETVGCAALALRPGYGEIKSMFVDPAARGTGAADALVHRLEAEARAAGLPCLRLETGNTLTAALRLYARHGFTRRGPFGDYAANATSLFMEKPLTGQAATP